LPGVDVVPEGELVQGPARVVIENVLLQGFFGRPAEVGDVEELGWVHADKNIRNAGLALRRSFEVHRKALIATGRPGWLECRW
jgi:hypothetical protein